MAALAGSIEIRRSRNELTFAPSTVGESPSSHPRFGRVVEFRRDRSGVIIQNRFTDGDPFVSFPLMMLEFAQHRAAFQKVLDIRSAPRRNRAILTHSPPTCDDVRIQPLRDFVRAYPVCGLCEDADQDVSPIFIHLELAVHDVDPSGLQTVNSLPLKAPLFPFFENANMLLGRLFVSRGHAVQRCDQDGPIIQRISRIDLPIHKGDQRDPTVDQLHKGGQSRSDRFTAEAVEILNQKIASARDHRRSNSFDKPSQSPLGPIGATEARNAKVTERGV